MDQETWACFGQGGMCLAPVRYRVVSRSRTLGYGPATSYSCGRHLAALIADKFDLGCRNPIEVHSLAEKPR
jgi:hypothetical protein